MTMAELVSRGKIYRNAGRFNDAYKCFLEAALNNDRDAIKNLGRCYLHGEGVRQDPEKASYYFELAKAAAETSMPKYHDVQGCDDSDAGDNDSDCFEDRRFNFTIGLEPMKRNVFKYIVEDVLRVMEYGEDYLSVAYIPIRGDKVSCIQSHPQENCELHYMEIIIKNDSKRGLMTLAKEGLSLKETIEIYKKVLVDYEFPNLVGWEDVTEKVEYMYDD